MGKERTKVKEGRQRQHFTKEFKLRGGEAAGAGAEAGDGSGFGAGDSPQSALQVAAGPARQGRGGVPRSRPQITQRAERDRAVKGGAQEGHGGA